MLRSFYYLKKFRHYLATASLFLLLYATCSAYTVTHLSATASNGQVFLTWKNVTPTNLQYNVYRGTSKFTQSSQLSSETYLGFVRDSSGKNMRLSQFEPEAVYFCITNGGTPLAANRGLYVVTSTGNQSYFYAVTITDLSTNIEDKSIVTSQNSLSVAVNETVMKPVPVLQFSEIWSVDETVDRYVLFVNNQSTPQYKAMNSTGSYGVNFYALKRGTATAYPMFLMEEGLNQNSLQGSGFALFADKTITNCYFIGVDDWLPIKKSNGELGDKTNWCGYHEDFNIYTEDNPLPTEGTVKIFTQWQFIEIIRWAKKNLPVDSNRIYTIGNSAGGYGAVFTALLFPEEITAVYALSWPFYFNTEEEPLFAEMIGDQDSKLNSDYIDWRTGDTIHIYELAKVKKMVGVDELLNVPLVFDVHGRNDNTIPWKVGTTKWYDSLQVNHFGGVCYWDNRDHYGNGAEFLDSETTPDFFRYATNISYPAFTNCSINQDPGDGGDESGDDVGATNGYLDWSDDIKDKECHYSINVFVKDLYIGGVLAPDQFSTCTTDITFRRLQNFHPAVGNTINWKNLNVNGIKIQNGSFVYNGGLITLPGIIVNKTGNTIKLKVPGCSPQRVEPADANDENISVVTRYPSSYGYTCEIILAQNENLSIEVFDLLGRLHSTQLLNLVTGTNKIAISSPGNGIFLVKIKGESFLRTEKLWFQ